MLPKDTQRVYDREPCGCYACDDGVQQGHFICSQPSEKMLLDEKLGFAVRVYEDNRWKWIVAKGK